jgi:hypothetical protein
MPHSVRYHFWQDSGLTAGVNSTMSTAFKQLILALNDRHLVENYNNQTLVEDGTHRIDHQPPIRGLSRESSLSGSSSRTRTTTNLPHFFRNIQGQSGRASFIRCNIARQCYNLRTLKGALDKSNQLNQSRMHQLQQWAVTAHPKNCQECKDTKAKLTAKK